MTALAAELSAIAGSAFAAEGLSAELGKVQASDRPDLAQFQCNGALPAAKAAKANPRAHRAEDRRPPEGQPDLRQGRDRRPRLHQSRRDRRGAGRAHGHAGERRPARRAADRRGQDARCSISAGPMSPSRCMSAICAPRSSATACSGCSAPMAGTWSATCIWAIGACRWASSSPRSARRGIAPVYFDAAFKGPYPEESPVTMDDLEEFYPAAVGGLQSRSGAAGGSARRHRRAAGRPARLSRAVAAFRRRLRTGPDARIRQPRRRIRSVEGRGQRRSADRADDRGSEGQAALR